MAILNPEKLERLHPAFLFRIRALEGLAVEKGLSIRWLFGYRSNEQQGKLHDRWLSNKNKHPKAVGPGLSWHQYGHAVDGVPFFDKDRDAKLDHSELHWDTRKPAWILYGALAESLGMIWGGRFKPRPDGPHIEWHPGFPKQIQAHLIPTLLHIRTNLDYWGKFSTAPEGGER